MEIKLEKFNIQDFHYYFQLVSNIEVMAMITESAVPRDKAEHDFQQLVINNQLHENFGNFKILDADTNEFIGLAKLEIKEIDADALELGYMLLPNYWGRGIASRVSQHLLDISKKENSIDQIFAIIDPKNLASRKILTRQGFRHKAFKDYDGLAGEILELKN
ncbi:GNAT family N-acetyltransferase [Acinetobacter sp. NIPH 2699]|uniref:GNAT family N-acetyltransferase n=1 Tax=Acinetobacter sp. NIPH 2699 TaxID=2923433 RepID=UPI001F4B2FD6|nr:GNAT family N-acetyltransferase [Acinetobacter sp. NIPH 2699]MCH7335906.1 GNAT family N-acetyltransferase [Acinetobacter sp. NIPH 2699]